MKKIKIIIQAYSFLLLYRLGLLEDSYTETLRQRENACKECPLRKGKWCSKKKVVIKNLKIISGCGCYLPAKYFSQDTSTPLCPMDKWK